MSAEAVKKWRNATKERITESLGGKCVICGYDKCTAAMDTHHVDPELKTFSFSKMRANPISWARIVEELRNCVLLCSNCHREVHAGYAEVPKNATSFNDEYEDYLAEKSKKFFDTCPVCGGQKIVKAITCSLACAATRSRKVDWDNIDVAALVTEHGNPERVGKFLGISGAAVRKRIKKLEALK